MKENLMNGRRLPVVIVTLMVLILLGVLTGKVPSFTGSAKAYVPPDALVGFSAPSYYVGTAIHLTMTAADPDHPVRVVISQDGAPDFDITIDPGMVEARAFTVNHPGEIKIKAVDTLGDTKADPSRDKAMIIPPLEATSTPQATFEPLATSTPGPSPTPESHVYMPAAPNGP